MAWSRWRGLGRWGALLVLVALLGSSGCGGPGRVSGKVSYKGEPLKGGHVTFIGAEGGRTVSASIREDGSYSVNDVPTGKVKVCVETETLNRAGQGRFPTYKPPPGMDAPKKRDADGATDPAKLYLPIPAKYGNPEQSPLSYDVKAGTQTIDIDLPP